MDLPQLVEMVRFDPEAAAAATAMTMSTVERSEAFLPLAAALDRFGAMAEIGGACVRAVTCVRGSKRKKMKWKRGDK